MGRAENLTKPNIALARGPHRKLQKTTLCPRARGGEWNLKLVKILTNCLLAPTGRYYRKPQIGWTAGPASAARKNWKQRRHLSESQRAMVAAKLANLSVGDNRGAHREQEGSANLQTLTGVSQSEAASLLNVSPRSVATFGKFAKGGSE